jgi:glycosyltransferase involved in cell wall biosynthesis
MGSALSGGSVDLSPPADDRTPVGGVARQPNAQAPAGASRRVAVSAAGVWVGGGRVLLEGLLSPAGSRVSTGLFDERARDWVEPLLPPGGARFVRPNLHSRVAALYELAGALGPNDVLLCFNSLPPPIRSAARTVVFVQVAYIAGIVNGIRYAPRAAMRHAFERMWFRAFRRNVDEFWVQTETIANALARQWSPTVPVCVVPLADPMLLPDAAAGSPVSPVSPVADVRGFVYPADGMAHKNHERLLRAWAELARGGAPPSLVLTLRPHELRDAARRAGVDPGALSVTSVGPVPRERVMALLREHGALVFPSLVETFGLPLVEAMRAGARIVASERDFVRDVCLPDETFDPESPVSIARAVGRLIGREYAPVPLVSPEAFLERLRLLPRRG